MGALEKHEFRPRPEMPRICHVCGRHEHSLLHLVTPKQQERRW